MSSHCPRKFRLRCRRLALAQLFPDNPSRRHGAIQDESGNAASGARSDRDEARACLHRVPPYMEMARAAKPQAIDIWAARKKLIGHRLKLRWAPESLSPSDRSHASPPGVNFLAMISATSIAFRSPLDTICVVSLSPSLFASSSVHVCPTEVRLQFGTGMFGLIATWMSQRPKRPSSYCELFACDQSPSSFQDLRTSKDHVTNS